MTDQTNTDTTRRRQFEPGLCRTVEPGNKDGTAAFKLVSSMETEVTTIRDMARLLTMAVEGNTSIEDEQVGALQRLGWLINDQCTSLERKRGDAFDALHGFCAPLPPGARV